MSNLLLAETVTVNGAIETTPGTQATTGWMQHQPNPGGINNFYAQIKTVARSPLSANRMDERGDIVDLDAMPALVHDFNLDLIRRYGESTFLAKAKYPGGSGVGFWQVNAFPAASVPTISAVSATAITVSGGGALVAGVLLWCEGFANPLNNGLRVVGAASTNTSITVSGGAIEASPPQGATVDVVGYQAAATDFAINAGGQLTSIANVFTTLGLLSGMWYWLGGGTAAAPGSLGFATAADRGFSRITTVAAGVLTSDRKTQAWSVDVGTGKTIQIFFGPWLRNVPFTHADYQLPQHTLELVLPGLDTAGATDYCYATGCGLGSHKIDAPLTDKIVSTLSFVGLDVSDPATARATNAASALPPIATNAFNTASEMRRISVADQASEVVAAGDVENWSLTINNNLKAYKKQGTLGGAALIVGRFQASLTIDAALTQPDLWRAARTFNNLSWAAAVRNNNGGVVFDMPALTANTKGPQFPANDIVKFSVESNSFRDTTYNYVLGQTTFRYLPAN